MTTLWFGSLALATTLEDNAPAFDPSWLWDELGLTEDARSLDLCFAFDARRPSTLHGARALASRPRRVR